MLVDNLYVRRNMLDETNNCAKDVLTGLSVNESDTLCRGLLTRTSTTGSTESGTDGIESDPMTLSGDGRSSADMTACSDAAESNHLGCSNWRGRSENGMWTISNNIGVLEDSK